MVLFFKNPDSILYFNCQTYRSQSLGYSHMSRTSLGYLLWVKVHEKKKKKKKVHEIEADLNDSSCGGGYGGSVKLQSYICRGFPFYKEFGGYLIKLGGHGRGFALSFAIGIYDWGSGVAGISLCHRRQFGRQPAQ